MQFPVRLEPRPQGQNEHEQMTPTKYTMENTRALGQGERIDETCLIRWEGDSSLYAVTPDAIGEIVTGDEICEYRRPLIVNGTAAEIDTRQAAFQVAQLRHLYAQMVNGGIGNQAAAARGLLSPAIGQMEKMLYAFIAAQNQGK